MVEILLGSLKINNKKMKTSCVADDENEGSNEREEYPRWAPGEFPIFFIKKFTYQSLLFAGNFTLSINTKGKK